MISGAVKIYMWGVSIGHSSEYSIFYEQLQDKAKHQASLYNLGIFKTFNSSTGLSHLVASHIIL